MTQETTSLSTDGNHQAALAAGLRELWKETRGESGIVVAVLDGPVELDHPSLEGARLRSLDGAIAAGRDTPRISDHGTHVTSIVFGQEAEAVRGVAPACSGLILPIYDIDEGGGLRPASQSDLARAIARAVDLGAHVINVSGGQLTESGRPESFLEDAVRYCDEKGVLVVSAVGNDGCNCLHVPASIPSVLAVGACDARGRPLDFSNWDETYGDHGVMCSGEAVLGAITGGGTAEMSGTSFATPIVSGIAALLLALQTARGWPPDPRAVRAAILESAIPCDPASIDNCTRLLAGIVNVTGARDLIMNQQPSASPGHRATGSDARIISPAPSRTARPALDVALERSAPAAPRAMTAEPPSLRAAELGGASGHEGIEAPDEGHIPAPSPQREVDTGIGTGGAATGASEPAPAPATALPGEPPPATPPAGITGGTAGGITMTQPSSLPGQMPAMSGAGIPAMLPGRVLPAECACQNAGPPELIYALGTLGYDFGTWTRYDWYVQQMASQINYRTGQPYGNPLYPPDFVDYLGNGVDWPGSWTSFIWTLEINSIPVYAIQPAGPFSYSIFYTLRSFLYEQVMGRQIWDPNTGTYNTFRSDRVSVPAQIVGNVTLLNGLVLPLLQPSDRALFNWNTEALIRAATDGIEPPEVKRKLEELLRQLFTKLYYQLQNMGYSAHDRALNMAGTNVYELLNFWATLPLTEREEKFQKSMIQNVRAEPSKICRPGSDCWDLIVTMFNPSATLTEAKTVTRMTIDVSDVVPVMIGEAVSWPTF